MLVPCSLVRGSQYGHDHLHVVVLSAVAFELEAEGFGCVLETSSINNGLIAFLDKMKTMTASPLLSISAEWRYLNQTLVPIAATKTYENAPAGTVKIPKTDAFRFQSRGVMIEGTKHS